MIKAAVLLSGFICFAAFSWGVKRHFRLTGAMPLGMKVTSGLTILLFLWFVVRLCADVSVNGWLPALILFLLSILIFIWAVGSTRTTPPTLAFDVDKPFFLLRHGPYRYVRHPFYLAYMLFWMGTAIAAHGILAWIAPILMLALYAHAAVKEEAKFSKSDLAAAYAGYRQTTGMFLPRPWR